MRVCVWVLIISLSQSDLREKKKKKLVFDTSSNPEYRKGLTRAQTDRQTDSLFCFQPPKLSHQNWTFPFIATSIVYLWQGQAIFLLSFLKSFSFCSFISSSWDLSLISRTNEAFFFFYLQFFLIVFPSVTTTIEPPAHSRLSWVELMKSKLREG